MGKRGAPAPHGAYSDCEDLLCISINQWTDRRWGRDSKLTEWAHGKPVWAHGLDLSTSKLYQLTSCNHHHHHHHHHNYQHYQFIIITISNSRVSISSCNYTQSLTQHILCSFQFSVITVWSYLVFAIIGSVLSCYSHYVCCFFCVLCSLDL